jgi:cytoskeleton protein RodZ
MSSEFTPGSYLRRYRERSGLSVEAVSAGSRIVPALIRALEADRHDLLPAPVYVRGFIRAYCDQVGADAEAALRLYEAQAVPAPPVTVRPALASPRPSRSARRWRPAVAGGVVLAALGIAVTVFLGRARQPDAVAARGAPTTAGRPATLTPPAGPTEPAALSGPAPQAASVPPGAPATPAPVAPPAAAATVERVLLIRAVETTWVRVTPDGGPPTEEMLLPGTVREWRSPASFRVTLGDAGTVELELDGHVLPAVGERGQVVRDVTIPAERRP